MFLAKFALNQFLKLDELRSFWLKFCKRLFVLFLLLYCCLMQSVCVGGIIREWIENGENKNDVAESAINIKTLRHPHVSPNLKKIMLRQEKIAPSIETSLWRGINSNCCQYYVRQTCGCLLHFCQVQWIAPPSHPANFNFLLTFFNRSVL